MGSFVGWRSRASVLAMPVLPLILLCNGTGFAITVQWNWQTTHIVAHILITLVMTTLWVYFAGHKRHPPLPFSQLAWAMYFPSLVALGVQVLAPHNGLTVRMFLQRSMRFDCLVPCLVACGFVCVFLALCAGVVVEWGWGIVDISKLTGRSSTASALHGHNRNPVSGFLRGTYIVMRAATICTHTSTHSLCIYCIS